MSTNLLASRKKAPRLVPGENQEDCMNLACFTSSLRTVIATTALISFFVLSSSSLRSQRLPQTVRPEHYTLRLTPDLKAATFSGQESIEVMLAEPTDRITINAAEITFESVSVTAGGIKLPATVALDKDKQQAT